MNVSQAIERVERSMNLLETALGEPAFDEWILVARTPEGWRLLEYRGPRKDAFLARSKEDLAALRGTLNLAEAQVGDFAFSHEGHGTGFDAYLCAGDNVVLLLNNTLKNTDEITGNPKWTGAQTHFGKLLEGFIVDPVVA